ncbi:hypothetical protein J437_LFUL007161 [Ladona fulva]|uniref:C2H2-type domain-containing protein n=1 Tax=Ladona fulva TaxID=123851 RepID=A0A8K0P1S3_LADFU|nr:hypothetical protein J437_LFUL007161 [Ladona fulva]
MTPSAEESGSCFSRSAPTVAHAGQFPINSNEVVAGPLENPNKYPFWCPICGKNFMRKDKLKQHSVVHSNERPFICRICGCSYKRKDKLTSHVTSSHLQHLPHQCDICGKRFVRKDKLKQHSVVHSNRRPFVCKLCDKKYKSKTELKKHEKRAHQ